ncbi:MAG: hypothetical protein ABIS21_05315 [Acidimicrobiales bacterium]
MKIFNREPAAIIGAVAGVLTLIVGFTDFLTDAQAGGIIALLTALAAAWTAWKVQPVAPSIFTGAITTGAALVATWGINITQEQVGMLVAAVAAILTAVVIRPQSTPAADPRPASVL